MNAILQDDMRKDATYGRIATGRSRTGDCGRAGERDSGGIAAGLRMEMRKRDRVPRMSEEVHHHHVMFLAVFITVMRSLDSLISSHGDMIGHILWSYLR